MEKEIWVDVIWYEGIYKVSNLWRLISCARTKTFKRIYLGKEYIQDQILPEKIMRTHMNIDGYSCMKLAKDGKYKEGRLHRIVYCSFNGIPLDFTGSNLICHKDDDRTNARLDNLYLGTQAENIEDMFRKGRQPDRKGEKHPCSKFTESDVKMIKQLLFGWAKSYLLARHFKVSPATIWAIKSGGNWSHISAF